MKKQRAVILTAALLIAGSGFFHSAYSDNLLLKLPPIFAGNRPSNSPALNDTGIIWSGNYASGNNATCISSNTPNGDNVVAAQDCSQGRDVTHNDNLDGHAGFSYTKLDSNGEPLADQAADYATTPWDCVKDNVTGLIWEVKTDDGGLHDKDDTYTWYNTNAATNGGSDGVENPSGNTCFGWSSGNAATYCNTQAYVSRVNAAGLCGAATNDWRMPTIKELESLVHYGRLNPSIDSGYIPNTVFPNVDNQFSAYFWSGSPDANDLNSARFIGFGYGDFYILTRASSYAVRLVRSGQ